MAGIAEAQALAAMSARRAEARAALRLAILRSAADGLSQQAIAQRCGTSKTTVGLILRSIRG